MLSVIIVEDEVLAAERLRILLEECNVVILNVFHHAQPALDWLSMHEVDIVFADIGLPEITGLELVERIKRVAKTPARNYLHHRLRRTRLARPSNLAAADYLLKPIRSTRLQAALDRVSEKIPRKSRRLYPFPSLQPRPHDRNPVAAGALSDGGTQNRLSGYRRQTKLRTTPKPWSIGKNCWAKKSSASTATPSPSATP